MRVHRLAPPDVAVEVPELDTEPARALGEGAREVDDLEALAPRARAVGRAEDAPPRVGAGIHADVELDGERVPTGQARRQPGDDPAGAEELRGGCAVGPGRLGDRAADHP